MKRWCDYCGRKFEKNGSYNRICSDCHYLNHLLRLNNLEQAFKSGVAKIIKSKYILKDKVKDSFINIENWVIERQMWYIDDETKTQFSIMKLVDLKDILREQRKRLEVEVDVK